MNSITITDHARKRMLERGVCSEKKIERMTEKAWRSREWGRILGKKMNNNRDDEGIAFRLLNGYVFVFRRAASGNVRLVTVTGTSERIVSPRTCRHLDCSSTACNSCGMTFD